MIELPKPGPNETIGEYIKRLMETNIIKASDIPAAIKNFNTK